MATSKVQSIRPSPSETVARQVDIDRYGELDRQLELVEPIREEHGILGKKIQARHANADPSAPTVETGVDYQVYLTARRNERTIKDKRKAFNALKKAVGLDGIIAMLDTPLGVLDKHVPKSEQAAFIHEERSGYRTLTVVPLRGPAMKEAA